MRTTVTLDADTEALVRRRLKERHVSFKQALNDAIREGALAAGRGRGPLFETATAALGIPTVNLDRASQTAAEVEDEELVRKMRLVRGSQLEGWSLGKVKLPPYLP